jgi:hypothetical protein
LASDVGLSIAPGPGIETFNQWRLEWRMRAFNRRTLQFAFTFFLLAGNSLRGMAQEPAAGSEAERAAIVAKGLEFLKTKGQGEDGLFTGKAGPGVTALAIAQWFDGR